MIPSDISSEQHEDILCRDRAERMASALAHYGSARHFANKAVARGDLRSAAGFRADARAALHCFPKLLAMVELDRATNCYSVARACDMPGCDFATVDRIDYWRHRASAPTSCSPGASAACGPGADDGNGSAPSVCPTRAADLTPSQDHARERCASLPATLNRVGEWTGR
jgi:hypothetical protein